MLKEKTAAFSMKCQGIPPCTHINRSKAVLACRGQPVCACGLPAHLNTTLRKQRRELEVTGESPWVMPIHVLQEALLS